MPGYIKLHRQLLESMQFRNPNTLKIWIWMLLKAAHKPRIVSFKIGKGYTDIPLEKGQFIFGRNKAEEQTGLDASLIYRVLKSLQYDNSIVVKSNNQYSIITICNFDTYNDIENEDEQPVNNRRTTDEQPVNTNKKVKKVNNRVNKLTLTDKEVAFVKLVSDITSRQFKTIDAKTRINFADLLSQNYTGKDFRKAITIALSEMTERGKEGYLTPEFILRPAEFQKYVTMAIKPKQQNLSDSTVYSPPAPGINHQHLEPTQHDS